ncbi:MAG: nitroreductase family protein [Lachnospiraceae bacterium]|nr:nitroreductase family protein [Lachnospiraceae bacterium]
MNQYEAIYIRQSVRHYSRKAVPAVLLRQIKNCAEKLPFLQNEDCCFVKIYNAREAQKKIKGMFRINAPYYMAVFTKKTSFSMIEAGCYAQKLVLYMTTKGLGTCYQGGSKLAESEIPENMQLAMIIAFGYAERELTRESKLARRQALNKLCRFRATPSEEFRVMLKAARLAPSAMNRQPWRFVVWDDRIDIYLQEDVLLKKISMFSQLFDIGIVLCHLLEAADEQWLPVEAVREDVTAAFKAGEKNSRYMITVRKSEL